MIDGVVSPPTMRERESCYRWVRKKDSHFAPGVTPVVGTVPASPCGSPPGYPGELHSHLLARCSCRSGGGVVVVVVAWALSDENDNRHCISKACLALLPFPDTTTTTTTMAIIITSVPMSLTSACSAVMPQISTLELCILLWASTPHRRIWRSYTSLSSYFLAPLLPDMADGVT